MEKETIKINQTNKNSSVIKKVLVGLKNYLTDWKNLLGHALLGVGLLVIAIWAPINVWIKLVIFVCLVSFNIWRMKRKKQTESEKE